MPAVNSQVGGYGHFFAGADPQQGAVVADAEAQPATSEWAAARALRGPCANLLKERNFAEREFAGLIAAGVHVLRIGHEAGGLRDGTKGQRAY